MATPFGPYANLRILWIPPGDITDFRSGVPSSGTPVLIEAFAKALRTADQELPGIAIGNVIYEGYVTRWIELPEDATWLDNDEEWEWTDDGTRPEGLLPGASAKGFLGDLGSLPIVTDGAERGVVTFTQIGQNYGVGGIGSIIREKIGDKFEAGFARAV